MAGNSNKPNRFIKSVFLVASGSAVSQLFLLLASPFLTRLYTPVQFAALAFFTAATSMLYVASTGRYELALMIPNKEEDAANLLVLSMLLPLVVSLITCLILLFGGLHYLDVFGIGNVDVWVYFLPISILLYAWHVSLMRWNSRKKLFKTMATSKIAYGVTGASSQVGMGYYLEPARESYLIIGQLIAYGASTAMYARKAVSDILTHWTSITLKKQLSLAKRFSRFPLFLGPSGIINFSASEMPTLLLLYYYSPEATGFYALGRRILLAPMAFVGDAVGEVFFQRVTSPEHGTNEANQRLLLVVWRNLLALVSVPTVILILYGREIFSFVFGAEWAKAGEYAAVLAPMLAVRFVVWPTRMMLQTTASQAVTFLWFVVFLIITVAVFVLSGAGNDPMMAIAYYSAAATVMYVIYAMLTYFYSSKLSIYGD